MTIASGSRLGPYEIVSCIGSGGMGEVWKARDTRIDRIVAIKTSHDRFTDRFAQEVRAIAALNHPHICTLYDVGPDYLVMEYVEGSEIKGPLPLDVTLKYAIQLASALEAAHRKGITHRDLKPANILVTKAGIKVLDFGLAKFEQSQAAAANDETLTRALTQEGSIVGTLQYMAPEQLQGKATDARADFFSFGCVLFEMLTGKRAFDGANTASVIAGILEREPPSMGAVAPASLDWLVRRCLAKDPDERWQSARDLRAALERVEVIAIEAHAAKPSRVPMLGWGVAAVAIIVAAAVSVIHFGQKQPEARPTRFSIAPPENNHFGGAGSRTAPAISPDGRQLVFSASEANGRTQLWLRPLDSLTALPLNGTENASSPFWSPDSKSIAFFSERKLKKMDIAGGSATTLADAPEGRVGTWSGDGVIIFGPTPFVLQQIPAAGGEAHSVIPGDSKVTLRFPWFLPDNRHFLYLYGSGGIGRTSIRVGSLDSPSEVRELPGNVDSFAVYSQGHLLFLRDNTLMARPFDEKRLAFTGEAVAVAEQVQPGGLRELAQFSVSRSGVLVYKSASSHLRLTWLDRTGKRVGSVGETGTLTTVQFSPDGKSAAVAIREAATSRLDIWLYDIARGLRTRFTSGPGHGRSPVWSPDGHTIIFSGDGNENIYRKAADGSGNEELLYADNLHKSTISFSPDGKYLAFQEQDPTTGFDLWILPDPLGPIRGGKPYPFLQTASNESVPQFSPDGRWIAYQSDEADRIEIYVRPFPGPGGKRQISVVGGTGLPRWRADGKELFYQANGQMMAAEVDGKNGNFQVGRIVALWPFQAGFFDVSADGQRFLAALPPESESAETLTVVQNWTAGLKK